MTDLENFIRVTTAPGVHLNLFRPLRVARRQIGCAQHTFTTAAAEFP